jgi:glycosyltransferase involved in cell wall biosynthesis
MPFFSVIIPLYNKENYIQEALRSILNQNFQDFEIISCDDASTDGTAEIIASFPQVIRLERPEGRYVPGKTLNRAIPQCHGDIIVFNNADAVPCRSDYLSKLLEPMLSDASVIAVFGNQLPRDDAQA